MAKRKPPLSQPDELRLDLKWIDGTEITSEAQLSQWSSEDKAVIDRQTLKALFYSEDWVYIAVDAIAQPLSRIPWLVYRKVMSNGKVTYLPDENHKLNALLENPTKDIDATSFKYMAFSEDALMGNAIIWYARSLNELHIIPSETCDYNFDKATGRPTALRVNGGEENTRPTSLPMGDLIHIQRAHTSNKWWGLSPFLPTRKSILFQKYFQDSCNAHYQRGAQPQAILKMDKEANEQNATRLLQKFEAAYAGRKNMRRTMILPKGVDFTSIDMTIADASTIELVNMNRESILNALHIPKHVVSLNEAGSLGSEEFKQALKYFWGSTLIPITERFAGKLTRFFAKELGPDRVIGFDFENVEILQDDKLKQALLAKEMLATMTINEVREKVWQLAAIENGDVIVSLMPPQSPFGSAPQPAEFSSQAEPQPTPFEGANQQPIPASEPQAALEETGAPEQKNARWFQKRAGMISSHHALMSAEETGKGKHYESFAAKIINGQIDAVTKALLEVLKTKAVEFDEDRFSKEYDKLVEDLAKQAAQSHEQELKNTMEMGYNSQLAGVFNTQDKKAIAALRARGANGRLSILNDRGLELFKWTSRTTKEQGVKKTRLVLEAIAQGVEGNRTVADIAKEIAQYLTNNSIGRAKIIARTEVLTAVSLGQQAMHMDAKEVIPGMQKIWLNAGDTRVRGNPGGMYPDADSDHWGVHGEVRGIDQDYSNGLGFPRDPRGAVSATIQCRCTQLVVAPEDSDSIDIPGVNNIPDRP